MNILAVSTPNQKDIYNKIKGYFRPKIIELFFVFRFSLLLDFQGNPSKKQRIKCYMVLDKILDAKDSKISP